MRNLVLLLTSGHTVRIALRFDDLTTHRPGPTGDTVRALLTEMPAVVMGTFPQWTFAYIEDPTLPAMSSTTPGGFEPPNDLQRITVEGPGTVVQYG